MSRFLLLLSLGSLVFSSCRKDNFKPAATPDPVLPCQLQTDNPAGRSYNATSMLEFTCNEKHCGMVPLHSKNYWVYQDSVYDNGTFVRVQYDTLRYSSNKKSLTDGLVWWESNMNVGLPAVLYSSDSAFYTLSERLFAPGILDAKKEFSIPAGDSVKFLSSFEDVAAPAKSVRLYIPVTTPAGNFEGCIYFEKNARNYRRDQVYFKPGLGVVKFIQEKAQPGSPQIKLVQVSTLFAVHIE